MPLDCRSFWSSLLDLPDIPVPSPTAPISVFPQPSSPSAVTSQRPVPRPVQSEQPNVTSERPAPRPEQSAPAEYSSLQEAASEAEQASPNDVDCTTATCPNCEIITGEMLADIYENASAADRDIAAKELNWFINRGQLDSELRLAHFLGQTRQETGGHILKSENLNYSVSALQAIFTSSYGRNPAKAQEDGRAEGQAANQENIANFAYANRIGNGDYASGDGWLYRGRGIKQLTGRANYRDFTEGHKELWLEDHDFEADPDSVATDAKYAVRSGIWFWISHNLGRLADGGATRAVADSITDEINLHDGSVGRDNRYDYMRNILDAGTFQNVCFNKTLATKNKKAWHPFGNNGR